MGYSKNEIKDVIEELRYLISGECTGSAIDSKRELELAIDILEERLRGDNRISIDLENGFRLVAEQGADPNYNREMFIFIEKENGVICQDLAVVRNAYEYYDDYDVKWKDDVYEVLVYGDENNEDYTGRFEIGRYRSSEEEENV